MPEKTSSPPEKAKPDPDEGGKSSKADNHDNTTTFSSAGSLEQTQPGAVAIDGPNISESNLDARSDDDSAASITPGLEEAAAADPEQGLGSAPPPVEAYKVDESEISIELEQRIREKVLREATKAHAVVENDQGVRNGANAWWKWGAILVALLGVIVVSVVLTIDSKNGEESIDEVTYLLNLLTPLSGERLSDTSSPQYAAFQWLLSHKNYSALGPYQSLDQVPDQMLFERYALAVFFFSTDGPRWPESGNFLSLNETVCQWNFVGCPSDNTVQGVVPQTVTTLSFEGSFINGTLPSEISALSSLVELTVLDSYLRGPIPKSLSSLHNLQVLHLKGGFLTGTIPAVLRHSQLREIVLSDNALTGSIPVTVTSLPKLTTLLLDSNMLNGSIPEFKMNGAMRRLHLQGNDLTGTLPQSLYSLSEMYELYVYQNARLTGTISTRIGQLQALEIFLIDGCDFYGSIPTEFGNLRVNWIRMNDNHFNGTIPKELGQIEDLWYLYLAENALTGSLPEQLGQLTNLEGISIYGNDITGFVPEGMANLYYMVELLAHNTSLDANFTDVFCARDIPILRLTADCAGEPPEVACSCCAECCNDATGACERDQWTVCRNVEHMIETEQEDAVNGFDCVCLEEGFKISCPNPYCTYCNADQSICYQEVGLGTGWTFHYNEAGETYIKRFLEAKYTQGTPNGTSFRFQEDDLDGLFCSVWINDQKCAECNRQLCENYELRFAVDCTNVEDGLRLNGCDQVTDAGALEILAGEDFLQGECVTPNGTSFGL